MSKLAKLLPFLDNGDIKDLATKIINKEVEGVKLMMVFPFLDSEDLSQIIDLLIEKKDVKNLRYSIPFASRKKIDEIYNAVKDGKLEGFNESFLYPFLSKDKLKEMFDQYVKEAAEKGEDAEDEDDELDEEFDD